MYAGRPFSARFLFNVDAISLVINYVFHRQRKVSLENIAL